MARRSSRKLLALYVSRRSRVPSLADGPGFLYAFVEHGVYWKVGMSIDYDRRKAEWERQCPCPSRFWLPPMRVLRRRKSESLAHLLLELVPRLTLKSSSSLVIGGMSGELLFYQSLHKRRLHNVYIHIMVLPRAELCPDVPISTTSRCPNVPISTTSRRPDVPTSRTPILGEIILKSLMLSTRRIFRENFKLSRENFVPNLGLFAAYSRQEKAFIPAVVQTSQ
ncbi:hypothetical protein GG344DRAFT_64761 [Lentinula edodes]|nr:hypothetical protein GG344DRAFT_64761 [Lentinula edodes]